LFTGEVRVAMGAKATPVCALFLLGLLIIEIKTAQQMSVKKLSL